MARTTRYVSSSGTDTYANSTSSSTPMSLTTAFANASAGDDIYIKADGTYSRSATDTPANSGTAANPIRYIGYSSTITDGYQGRTNGNGALVTTSMPLISYSGGNYGLAGGGRSFVIYESLGMGKQNGFFRTLREVWGRAFLSPRHVRHA